MVDTTCSKVRFGEYAQPFYLDSFDVYVHVQFKQSHNSDKRLCFISVGKTMNGLVGLPFFLRLEV